MDDIVDIVRTRLVDGRTIADSDVRLMADEIERLRAALTQIRDKTGQCNRAVDCQNVARRALSPKEANGG